MCFFFFDEESENDFFDDESDDVGSGSGLSGTFPFSFSKILLVVSVDYFYLVESLEYFYLVESLEYFYLVDSMEYFDLFESLEYFDLIESFEYFSAKIISSFKLRIFNKVTVWLYLAHSSLLNFCNTMPRRDPVGVIRQPFHSGNGGEYRIEFFRFVDGQEPQIHELWISTKDRINCEVHHFARVYVRNFSVDYFKTYYMTEEACRVTMFGQIFNNLSF